MDWYWLPEYLPKLISGLWLTIELLILCATLGFLLAVPIGLVQVTGPRSLALLARGFCTIVRGTPLLVQLWLIYYGLGSVFPQFEGLRETFLWDFLRAAFPYAAFAFIVSVAGYVGEVMRGAFAGVAKGELEAGRAMGMSGWTILRRIWFPRAVQNVFPTLAGEMVLTLKATPLASTITVHELFSRSTEVRQDTFLTYEPLLLVAGVYVILAGVIVVIFKYFENRIPKRGQT